MRKRIDSVERASIEALTRYDWPGNVRELRNVLERAMILAPGPTLSVAPPHSALVTPAAERGGPGEPGLARRRARTHPARARGRQLESSRRQRCGRSAGAQADDARSPHRQTRHPPSRPARLAGHHAHPRNHGAGWRNLHRAGAVRNPLAAASASSIPLNPITHADLALRHASRPGWHRLCSLEVVESQGGWGTFRWCN